MLQLTWDTNCLITLESDAAHRSTDKAALHQLLTWHDQCSVNIRLGACTAAEKQTGGTYLEHINHFHERRAQAGLGHLDMLLAPGRWDMTFWDNAVYLSDEDAQQIQDIHAAMFPGMQYEPPNPFDPAARATQRWRNRIIDADLYWSHLKYNGDLFVTKNSKDFIDGGRRDALLALGGRGIEVPTEAVQWVSQALTDPTDKP
jgi:hypothetical protein